MSGMDVPASSDRCADMTLNAPHHCPDWDFMFIRPGDPEMECCTCEHAPTDDQAIRASAVRLAQELDVHVDLAEKCLRNLIALGLIIRDNRPRSQVM